MDFSQCYTIIDPTEEIQTIQRQWVSHINNSISNIFKFLDNSNIWKSFFSTVFYLILPLRNHGLAAVTAPCKHLLNSVMAENTCSLQQWCKIEIIFPLMSLGFPINISCIFYHIVEATHLMVQRGWGVLGYSKIAFDRFWNKILPADIVPNQLN